MSIGLLLLTELWRTYLIKIGSIKIFKIWYINFLFIKILNTFDKSFDKKCRLSKECWLIKSSNKIWPNDVICQEASNDKIMYPGIGNRMIDLSFLKFEKNCEGGWGYLFFGYFSCISFKMENPSCEKCECERRGYRSSST